MLVGTLSFTGDLTLSQASPTWLVSVAIIKGLGFE